MKVIFQLRVCFTQLAGINANISPLKVKGWERKVESLYRKFCKNKINTHVLSPLHHSLDLNRTFLSFCFLFLHIAVSYLKSEKKNLNNSKFFFSLKWEREKNEKEGISVAVSWKESEINTKLCQQTTMLNNAVSERERETLLKSRYVCTSLIWMKKYVLKACLMRCWYFSLSIQLFIKNLFHIHS